MQNIFAIILFRASEDVEKRFEETLYKWDNGKKKKIRKVALATKNAYSNRNSRTVKWYEAGMYIGLFPFLVIGQEPQHGR